MIEAVIFDMDGLLVDSEPWWRVAETNVFGKLSVAPNESDFERMMGARIQEVIQQWYERHPWPNFVVEDTQTQIILEVERLVIEHAGLMAGVKNTLDFFKQQNIPVALASSSPLHLIRNLMQHYEIYDSFQLICSAEHEPYGKPHPAVFLTTAKHLRVDPTKCLVFEDSFNGVLAAKAARMKCVAIPAAAHYTQERFCIADLKLNSLEAFTPMHWQELCALH